jgi:hypothetical protein
MRRRRGHGILQPIKQVAVAGENSKFLRKR